MDGSDRRTAISTRLWVPISLVVGIFLLGFAVSFLRQEMRKVRAERYDSIRAIAELKEKEIESWRIERLADVLELSQSPLVKSALTKFFSSAGRSEFREPIIRRLRLEGELGLYSAAFVISPDGRTLIDDGSTPSTIDSSEFPDVAATIT